MHPYDIILMCLKCVMSDREFIDLFCSLVIALTTPTLCDVFCLRL